MRKMIANVILIAAGLAVRAGCADAHTLVLPGSHPSLASAPHAGAVVLAKLKCGFDENGEFSCKRGKRNHHDDDEDSGEEQGRQRPTKSNTEPENDAGTASSSNSTSQKPSKGQCFTVETTRVGSIECGADFPARSCGAVENGMITCCCAR